MLGAHVKILLIAQAYILHENSSIVVAGLIILLCTHVYSFAHKRQDTVHNTYVYMDVCGMSIHTYIYIYIYIYITYICVCVRIQYNMRCAWFGRVSILTPHFIITASILTPHFYPLRIKQFDPTAHFKLRLNIVPILTSCNLTLYI